MQFHARLLKQPGFFTAPAAYIHVILLRPKVQRKHAI
jgi:hypothetical protein